MSKWTNQMDWFMELWFESGSKLSCTHRKQGRCALCTRSAKLSNMDFYSSMDKYMELCKEVKMPVPGREK